ncbi:small integral membrane protein 3 isoform X2 [Rattus norvegicus]|uniref:small integral membrane protein 3 isoform X2 n=1 Tax=Rattus norvegicus TaxID=10116 RepID=UPI0003D0A479|nr:small integral membrane protein 3 isoform X2 [Rattus norvegicus]
MSSIKPKHPERQKRGYSKNKTTNTTENNQLSETWHHACKPALGRQRANMDAISQSPVDVLLPKHILDIWAIVLIILATVVIMTSLFLCPATAVIIYRMRTHPVLNGAV